MHYLAVLATGAFLIAASSSAKAGPFSPAGLSGANGAVPIELVAKKSDEKKSEKASAEKGKTPNGGNVAGAEQVGKLIAERAKANGVTKVVFDRGGYLYHGRVKALADAARKAGLEF